MVEQMEFLRNVNDVKFMLTCMHNIAHVNAHDQWTQNVCRNENFTEVGDAVDGESIVNIPSIAWYLIEGRISIWAYLNGVY